MATSGPIGLYDSGVGGLTVVREVSARLPRESVVYFGDTARMPYGGRTPAEILRYGREISRFLLDQGVKLILVACNTSSALALDALAAELPVPIIGVLKAGALAAARATLKGRIGILATAATAASGAYQRAVAALAPGTHVTVQGCPALVPLIEAGITDGPEIREVLAAYLQPLISAQIDTVVYGCTHYPFLDRTVAEMLGPEVARVDPAVSLVDQAVDYLQSHEAMTVERLLPDRYITSGDPDRFRAVGSLFLRRALPPVEQINLNGYALTV